MLKKKIHYLHVSYKIKIGEFGWSEGDSLFRLTKCSISELRDFIAEKHKKETNNDVMGVSLTSITELSKTLYNMLSEGTSSIDMK